MSLFIETSSSGESEPHSEVDFNNVENARKSLQLTVDQLDQLHCADARAVCQTSSALWNSETCQKFMYKNKVDALVRKQCVKANVESDEFKFVKEEKYKRFQKCAIEVVITSLTSDILNIQEKVYLNQVIRFLKETENPEDNIMMLNEKILHEIPLRRLVRMTPYPNPSPVLRDDYEQLLSPKAKNIFEKRIQKENDGKIKWYMYGTLLSENGEEKYRILQGVLGFINPIGAIKGCIGEYCELSDETYPPNSPYHISNWDVSRVTSMRGVFEDKRFFNQPLGRWNVENVTDMSYMFSNATNFNQSLNEWKVARVENMKHMFAHATQFDRALAAWDVINVKDMSCMFSCADSFNQPLNRWGKKLGKVNFMDGMFQGAKNFNRPLNGWNVESVLDMTYMFQGALEFDQSLEEWKNEGMALKVRSTHRMLDGTKIPEDSVPEWMQAETIMFPHSTYERAPNREILGLRK